MENTIYTGREGAIYHVWQLTYGSNQSVVIQNLTDEKVNSLWEGRSGVGGVGSVCLY